MKKILISGVNGQIGSELSEELGKSVGMENIIGLDLRPASPPYRRVHEIVDVTKKEAVRHVVEKYDVDTIFHLASLLSAIGEKNPDQAWEVNMTGLKNILDLARGTKIKVFWPSSIAVFGPNSPKHNTPQETIIDPNTMYGITKRAGELLCQYYFEKFDVDVRSVRYPGIISHKTEPGGGTTDYAVEIFYEAVKHQVYTCFVGPETRLPMMYMNDAIKAAVAIMQADSKNINVRTSYNLSAVSFTVAELVTEIKKHIPDFKCRYAPDFRQEIANSWPRDIDDTGARQDWGWRHEFDLASLTKDMLQKLQDRVQGSQL
ncbi:MAG: NAD-dependent epimerase/dehydratase family protein [bacterium]